MPAVDELSSLVARLEVAVAKLEASSGQGSAEDLAASVTAYDELVANSFKPFSDLCKKIGGDVATLGAMLDKAFAAQREFLANSAKSCCQSVLDSICGGCSDKAAAKFDLLKFLPSKDPTGRDRWTILAIKWDIIS